MVQAHLALVALLTSPFVILLIYRKNPNPRRTKLFVNQSAVTIKNKDFRTRLVSLFTSERGISPIHHHHHHHHRIHDDLHHDDFISHYDVWLILCRPMGAGNWMISIM
jgi:hypothetical protein